MHVKYLNSNVTSLICERAACRRGVSMKHAKWFAHVLIETSLMGIDTHGLRLLPLYLRELDEGRSNPSPKIKLLRKQGGIATVDADSALGAVAGMHASHLVVDIAKKNGIGAVAVGNSNHFGAASIYGLEIAREGLIGIITTSAAARMAPFNGKQPMFGTNPICFAAPAIAGKNYLLDMATSQISYSQIKHYRKNGHQLPIGWALDEMGEYTQKPDQVVSLAALGGYKGQGLAMMVEILSCLLSNMPLDHELEHLDTGRFDIGRNIGHFMLAIDVKAFTNLTHFQNALMSLMNVVRATPARVGKRVLVAGDLQTSIRQERLVKGIPASAEEVSVLLNEAKLLEIPNIDQLIFSTN